MESVRVHIPPGKPLMIFDGDCQFCSYWIRRWQHATADRVEYLPSQDEKVAEHFPEIPRKSFEESVQLVEPDGAVYSGAEAVFRSLAANPRRQRWLRLYQRRPVFARLTEWGYHFIAQHRTFFSKLTKLLLRPY